MVTYLINCPHNRVGVQSGDMFLTWLLWRGTLLQFLGVTSVISWHSRKTEKVEQKCSPLLCQLQMEKSEKWEKPSAEIFYLDQNTQEVSTSTAKRHILGGFLQDWSLCSSIHHLFLRCPTVLPAAPAQTGHKPHTGEAVGTTIPTTTRLLVFFFHYFPSSCSTAIFCNQETHTAVLTAANRKQWFHCTFS